MIVAADVPPDPSLSAVADCLAAYDEWREAFRLVRNAPISDTVEAARLWNDCRRRKAAFNAAHAALTNADPHTVRGVIEMLTVAVTLLSDTIERVSLSGLFDDAPVIDIMQRVCDALEPIADHDLRAGGGAG